MGVHFCGKEFPLGDNKNDIYLSHSPLVVVKSIVTLFNICCPKAPDVKMFCGDIRLELNPQPSSHVHNTIMCCKCFLTEGIQDWVILSNMGDGWKVEEVMKPHPNEGTTKNFVSSYRCVNTCADAKVHVLSEPSSLWSSVCA